MTQQLLENYICCLSMCVVKEDVLWRGNEQEGWGKKSTYFSKESHSMANYIFLLLHFMTHEFYVPRK